MITISNYYQQFHDNNCVANTKFSYVILRGKLKFNIYLIVVGYNTTSFLIILKSILLGSGKEARSNSARQNRFSERSGDKPPGSAKRNQRTRKKEINSTLGK